MARALMAASISLLAVLLLPAAALAQAPQVANQLVFDASVFPAAGNRPPLWDFPKLSSATAWSCKPVGKGWTLSVKHAPIPGVNQFMMRWLFANLATGSATSPLDGKTYPLFLLMHPRDHAKHTSSAAPGQSATGSKLTWVEFPLTGCTKEDTPDKWACPSAPDANAGWTQESDPAAWAKADQVNGTSTLAPLSSSMARFNNRGCNDRGQCANVVVTTQAWRFNKRANALQLTTKLRVGIGMPTIDATITEKWANGLDPREKCERMAAHYVQEYGALKYWLPDAYKAAGSPKPAGRRLRA